MLMQQRRLSAVLIPVLAAMLLPGHLLALETGTRADHTAVHQPGQDFRRYCIAALQGDREAAYHLGWLRLNGYGTAADDALAAGWFKMAARHGDTHSQRILDDLLSDVEPGKDSGCPLGKKRPDRATIEAWVWVLAPGYGLDARLLLALIEVESRFNPRARSPKNARGLMQLMPATARRFKVKDIWDPVENLMGGMAYLRWLLDRYEGDINLSLAAYNAGEHAVERHGGIPPYRETRNYVKSINRIYSRSMQSGMAATESSTSL